MVNLTRNKRTIYLCKKKDNSLEFEEPLELKVNYIPTYSSSDVIALGSSSIIYQTIKCTPKIAKQFSNRDRIYLNKPTTFQSDCNDADYYVYGNPRILLNEAEVTIRQMDGDEDYVNN